MDVRVTNSGGTAISSSSSDTASHASPTEHANSIVSNTTASTTAGQNEVLQSANALRFSSVGRWIVDTNSIPPFHHFELDVEAVQLSDAVYTSLTEAAASTIIGRVHTAQSLETNFASVGIWSTDRNVTTAVENPRVTSERQTPVPTNANTPNTASLGAFFYERSSLLQLATSTPTSRLKILFHHNTLWSAASAVATSASTSALNTLSPSAARS